MADDHGRATWLPLVIALLPALAATALYWPTLDLPLLYDDLLHIRISGNLTFASVWLPAEAFGFYRPLTFLPLLLIERIFGYYPAALLHGLNVAQHALNATLLAWLAGRLWGWNGRALAAGLLLACFPFSYQAVAVYGHNVHPATAGLLLLALHTYLTAQRYGRARQANGRWWGLTGLLFVLGLLSHESAILFGPFAFLVQWVDERRLPLPAGRSLAPYVRQPWLIFTALGVLYLIGYQFLPLSRAPQAGFGGAEGWWAKLLYLWQALIYPVAWIGSYLLTGSFLPLFIIATVLLIGLLLWAARRPEIRPSLVLGLGWWALASALIAVPLPAGYLLHGPRLLYLGSVGLALLWALLLPAANRLVQLVVVGLLLLLLAQNILFVRGKLRDYAALTAPVQVVAETMSGRPTDEGLLLVNWPQWLAPAWGTYPVGVEIVSMLGDYLFVEELLHHNLRVDRPVQTLIVPELLSSRTAYSYGTHEQAPNSLRPERQHVFITRYTEVEPQTSYTGFVQWTAGDASTSPLATFPSYTLLAAQSDACEGSVRVALTWRPVPPVAPTTSIFVQLFAADGTLLAQADGPPLGLRPDLLEAEQFVEERWLETGGSEPAYLLLGEYDYATGERHRGQDTAGNPLPDNAYRLAVEACDG